MSVPASRWSENAHTRRVSHDGSNVIVRGERSVSGRFDRCIPVGEWRGGAYRVRKDVLDAWGGLSVKDGFIQRSAVLPTLLDPPRFMRWFESQAPRLVSSNNP